MQIMSYGGTVRVTVVKTVTHLMFEAAEGATTQRVGALVWACYDLLSLWGWGRGRGRRWHSRIHWRS